MEVMSSPSTWALAPVTVCTVPEKIFISASTTIITSAPTGPERSSSLCWKRWEARDVGTLGMVTGSITTELKMYWQYSS